MSETYQIQEKHSKRVRYQQKNRMKKSDEEEAETLEWIIYLAPTNDSFLMCMNFFDEEYVEYCSLPVE